MVKDRRTIFMMRSQDSVVTNKFALKLKEHVFLDRWLTISELSEWFLEMSFVDKVFKV